MLFFNKKKELKRWNEEKKEISNAINELEKLSEELTSIEAKVMLMHIDIRNSHMGEFEKDFINKKLSDLDNRLFVQSFNCCGILAKLKMVVDPPCDKFEPEQFEYDKFEIEKS